MAVSDVPLDFSNTACLTHPMRLSLTPELDAFAREQARQHGLDSASDYVARLISAQRDRETHDWDWLHTHLRSEPVLKIRWPIFGRGGGVFGVTPQSRILGICSFVVP